MSKYIKAVLIQFVFILLIYIPGNLTAQVPALREQILLNGNWLTGGIVPQYGGIDHFKEKTFEREVAIPASWKGKLYKLEFGSVNFIATIYINNKQVLTHIGGWIPFSLDISKLVAAGKTFHLKVNVKGASSSPIANGKGSYNWPVGGWSDKGGISDDVWLRAYGKVYIDDAFIQTSFRKKELSVNYTLTNTTSEEKTVNIVAKTTKSSGGDTVLFIKNKVNIPPHTTLQVKFSKKWENPSLWWPDNPVLYNLTSEVLAGNKQIDKETRRFGFREFWTKGNQFLLNGIRINLYGDYQSFASTYYTSPDIHTPENWPQTIDQMKYLNMRIIRFHHNPVPQYILNTADEKGLLICDESAHYGRKYLKNADRVTYVKNGEKWIKPWIKADRNHPSIYMWNATNEMTYNFVLPFHKKEILKFGDAIEEMDTTRVIGYDGEKDIGSSLIDFHYPEGYNMQPAGSIYSWANKVNSKKPTGSGELLHTKSPLPEMQVNVERNSWWLGIWTRGLRYTNWTNVKPACFWFTQQDLTSKDSLKMIRTINLKNAYAPIALFDKAYDDLGISPYVTGTVPGGNLPLMTAGNHEKRSLVLYNDEFSQDTVKVEVAISSAGKIFATATAIYRVKLGEHIDIKCEFQVPYIPGKELDLCLKTFKNNKIRFQEIRKFNVKEASVPISQTNNKLVLSLVQ